MILEIKKYPDPTLRKKTEKVKEIAPEIKKLIQNMIETMLKSEPEGVGLAAPQIGISKRIFIAQTESGPAVFINHKIIKKGRKTEIMEEGCLSLPKTWLKIKRAKEIDIEALDINGKKIETKAEGMFAKILQHEVDHLNGVLIKDKVNFFQKLKRTL